MEQENLLKIKEIFKRYMKQNRVTIADLSKLLEISEGTIRTYLSGTKFVSLKFISHFLTLKKINKEDRIFLKKLLKNSKEVPTIKIKKIPKENKTIGNEFDLTKSLREIEENIIKEILKINNNSNLKLELDDEIKKINSLRNDYETVNRIMKVMWVLNDESTKYFSELNLLLSTNDINSNIKLKKGILEVSNNLIKMGEKLKSYLEENSIIELEEEQWKH